VSSASSYKKEYEDSSKTASDLSRNLAFAGIGIIWIFTKTKDTIDDLVIPFSLLVAAILLVVALFLDIMQYTYKTIIWYLKFRSVEKKCKENNEIEHSTSLNLLTWICFYTKIGLVIISYIFIINFLFCSILTIY